VLELRCELCEIPAQEPGKMNQVIVGNV